MMNDSAITLYHNPRCSKSRATLALIEEHISRHPDLGLMLNEIRYLDSPPGRQDIERLLQLLDARPIDLIRSGDALFGELGLRADMSDAELIGALAEHPALLQRPVVVHAGRAAIGRPPENVLEILNP